MLNPANKKNNLEILISTTNKINLDFNLNEAAKPPNPEPISIIFLAIFLWPILTGFFLKSYFCFF